MCVKLVAFSPSMLPRGITVKGLDCREGQLQAFLLQVFNTSQLIASHTFRKTSGPGCGFGLGMADLVKTILMVVEFGMGSYHVRETLES